MPSPALAPLQRIRFETVPGTVDEVLPRMDIAAFVGFAASGPVHLPVAIEDVKQYTRLFGDDPALAWDTVAEEPVRARLGAAVATFFANGGQRCWVVRVAGAGATHNYFPLPGMLRQTSSSGSAAALARSRSPGSWSDSLTVRAALRTRALPVLDPGTELDHISLAGSSNALNSGDLVRLRFGSTGLTMFWLYAGITALPTVPIAGHREYTLAMATCFAAAAQHLSAIWTEGVTVWAFGAHDDPASADPADAYAEVPVAPETVECGGRLRLAPDGRAELEVSAGAEFARLARSGALLRVESAAAHGWLAVQERLAEPTTGIASSPEGTVILSVTGPLYWESDVPAVISVDFMGAELLTLDIAVSDGQERLFTLRDVGLTNMHARAWSDLHGDMLRYRPRPHATPSALDDEARVSAFPLAAVGTTSAVADNAITDIYVPLGLEAAMGVQAEAFEQSADALQRDGLERYDASLFLDDALVNAGSANLMAEADYLRYGAPWPRPLRGIHALLGYADIGVGEETTLVAVPDALHSGWTRTSLGSGDLSVPEGQATAESSDGEFRACNQSSPAAPLFRLPAGGNVAGGALHLAWSEVAGCTYRLQESTTPDFTAAAVLYEGPGRSVDVHRPDGGRYSYRVQALAAGQAGAWSEILTVVTGAQARYVATPVEVYDTTLLYDVQTALLRLCAAQGEFFAVLGLPHHFRITEARDHLAKLAADLPAQGGISPLSYGAVYHPWLKWWSTAGAVETLPPDGAAMGVLAERAARRGAWVAPGNQTLAGVVALTQALEIDDDIPLNILRAEPRGFMAARAETLDVDLSLINVRRLLILLRRLALRHGATYAFEPNGPALHRLVQTRFEELMRGLYNRGAFAGQKPSDAYRVDAGDNHNTAVSMEQGRFIVALQVRPSRPMEFITVRLVQHGNQLNVSEMS